MSEFYHCQIDLPIRSDADAIQIYGYRRLWGKIEHGYRFEQEQGQDVKDLRVQTLERMRRLFALVLAAAQFIFHLMQHWPRKAATLSFVAISPFSYDLIVAW